MVSGARSRSPPRGSRTPSPLPPGGAAGAADGGSPPLSPTSARSPGRRSRNRKPVDQQLACVPADAGLVSGRIPKTYWLYASFEFKMSVALEQAMQICFRKVDQLCEKLVRYDLVPVEALGMLVTARLPRAVWSAMQGELNYKAVQNGVLLGAIPSRADAARLQRGMRLHQVNGRPVCNEEDVAAATESRSAESEVEVKAGYEARGDIVFDIIATRKQIDKHLSEQTVRQSPHRLGAEIYRYVAERHDRRVATAFVGLTDNTARRVGRDVYCRSEELSPKKYDFDLIDNKRMFIIDPPDVLAKGPQGSGEG